MPDDEKKCCDCGGPIGDDARRGEYCGRILCDKCAKNYSDCNAVICWACNSEMEPVSA